MPGVTDIRMEVQPPSSRLSHLTKWFFFRGYRCFKFTLRITTVEVNILRYSSGDYVPDDRLTLHQYKLLILPLSPAFAFCCWDIQYHLTPEEFSRQHTHHPYTIHKKIPSPVTFVKFISRMSKNKAK